MEFPIFQTKIKGKTKRFDLNNPKERLAYFNYKAEPEIKKLRNYLDKGNSFVAYLLGKKSSGKGTYAKMMAEIVDSGKIDHFSIGDMIRRVDGELKDKNKKKKLVEFIEKNYRGWVSPKELISLLEKRSTTAPLLPTELILALVKREMGRRKKKTLFIDGFPRGLDQINFSLFFRDLIGYRDDPDIFVLISVPTAVIDERMKARRICPQCQTSRNLRLLPTPDVGYDKKKKEFYLFCDNPKCKKVKLIQKEGDHLGIKPIKPRLKKDEELIAQAFNLYGVPKVFLRNAIPVLKAKSLVDDYEITPEYHYSWNEKKQRVEVKEKPWIVEDDDGEKSYSLLAPPVVVALIKQIVKALNL